MKWIRVTPKFPCPVCHKPDWCGYSGDGRFAVCMRVPSEKPTQNGGYLHRIIDAPLPPVPVRSKPVDKPSGDIQKHWNTLKHTLDPEGLYGLAEGLGVSLAALTDLQASWSASASAWAFPMRGGDGKVVGIRLRSGDGRKWAVRGSREGLFYPDRAPDDHTAVICEGPTDTAAALTLGLWAVGRPSCTGGVPQLKALCRRLVINFVVVVGDNDPPKARPGGHWQPGFDGARKLGAALGLRWKLLIPPAKDLRAWVGSGATREDFDALIHEQDWRAS
jgi:hypothetical protein